jgi:hypothetical protein
MGGTHKMQAISFKDRINKETLLKSPVLIGMGSCWMVEFSKKLIRKPIIDTVS